tara:strand:- start:127 stop:894 length:768 start_codon:yes stop_codon:yes gene_type:complete
LLPISCYIITKNESRKIKKVIESVSGLVNEIIIIDSGSTDKTLSIAKTLGAKVMFNKWDGYGKQKRFGEKVCKNDWVLNLDGDEIVSSDLNQEIRNLFLKEKKDMHNLYLIKRQNIFPFGINPYSYSGDKVIRLYRKSVVRYPDHPTWDKIKKPKNQKTTVLNGVIYHYWMKDFEHQVSKMNKYTTSLANFSPKKSMSSLTLRMVFGFQFDFFKAYLLRHHWLQGRYGFAVSILYAFTRFMRVIKMMEKQLRKNS